MNNNSRVTEYIILGICIIIGLSALGYFISKSAFMIKSSNRSITVKGLAEREVKANIAIWPISFKETGDDLILINDKIDSTKSKIESYLKEQGFTESEISLNPPIIKDLFADEYFDSRRKQYRYIAKTTITVHSKKVDQVRNARTNISKLIKAGVAVSGSEYGSNVQFLYTKLNEIKPQMIEEATKNARSVADKFAKDSESKLGKIKNARQGIFSITNRDSNTPYLKKVRVVSTIEYFLVDN